MKRLLILLLPAIIFSQDISSYQKLIDEGHAGTVRKVLVQVKKKYPDSPQVMYLDGVLEPDGTKALLRFKDVLSQYPNSTVADNSLLKIIEYLYVKGLYKKTIQYAKEMLKKYPTSEVVGDGINLMLCSYNAMNMQDSVDFFYEHYIKMYPNIDINLKYYRYTSNLKVTSYSKESKPASLPSTSVVQAPPKKPEVSEGEFSLQVGAYANAENAYYIRNRLKAKGYSAYTEKIKRKQSTLISVRVGPFATRGEAEKVSARLKSNDRIDNFIVRN